MMVLKQKAEWLQISPPQHWIPNDDSTLKEKSADADLSSPIWKQQKDSLGYAKEHTLTKTETQGKN
jgi:hypothetical protein